MKQIFREYITNRLKYFLEKVVYTQDYMNNLSLLSDNRVEKYFSHCKIILFKFSGLY